MDARSNIHYFPTMQGFGCDGDSMGKIHRYQRVHSSSRGFRIVSLYWILPRMWALSITLNKVNRKPAVAVSCFVYEVIGSGLILTTLLSTLNRKSPTRRSNLVPLMICIHVTELIFWTIIGDILAYNQVRSHWGWFTSSFDVNVTLGWFFHFSLSFCWHRNSKDIGQIRDLDYVGASGNAQFTV